jgi:hypothetical protein
MTKEEWSILAGRAGAVLNFGIKEKEWLKTSKMARLIAATPFLAGCDKPEETAFSHLILYLVSLNESARDIYLHRPVDDRDVYTRLFPVSNFLGGNLTIIQCILDLMALTMLSNYHQDAEEDRRISKYNPLNEGKWNYKTESERLIQSINANSTPEIAAIYTVEDALKGYWKN